MALDVATLGAVSVMRRDALVRWLAVGLGVAVVCSLPAVIALWPAPAVATDPGRLRELVLASAERPYQGYVDSRGQLNLPKLPVLGEVLALAGDSTRIRAWYAGPQSWRVAVLRTTGERDVYRNADGTYLWDFERNLIGFTPGDLPIRLPWAADVVPPDLARRVLSSVSPQDRVTALPARRIAGVAAAGLRVTPADPRTTVGSVDIWADPDSGLPVRVQITGRGSTDPVLITEFLDLAQTRPDARSLTPPVPESAGLSVVGSEDVANAVGQIAPVPLPDSLAGRPALRETHADLVDPTGRFVITFVGVPGISAYGGGLSTFVVLALPGRVGFDAMETARKARGTPVRIGGAQGYELRVDLLTALLIRSEPVRGDDGRVRRRTYLLAGLVDSDLLREAATELLRGAA
jgi:hypothetical protein